MHFIKHAHARVLSRPYAMVEVEVVEKRKLVIKGIAIAKRWTLWAQLPEDVQIFGECEVVSPHKQCWISVETINPIHAVIDAGLEIFR